MAMEVSCGQCNGRLLVETPGVVIACPHCGAHLMAPLLDLPAEITADSTASSLTSAGSTGPTDQTDGSAAETMVVKGSSTPIVADPRPQESKSIDGDPREVTRDDPSPSISSDHQRPEPPQPAVPAQEAKTEPAPDSGDKTVPDSPAFDRGVQTPTFRGINEPDFSWMSAAANSSVDRPVSGFTLSSESSLVDATDTSAKIEDAIPPVAAPFAGFGHESNVVLPAQEFVQRSESDSANGASTDLRASGESLASVGGRAENSSPHASLVMLLIVVGSYASLLTIYVAYLFLFGRRHQLESLPDLKTVQQQGGRAVVPRPDNDLPPGHELRIGQTRRFGNIQATPLRVTRGPITFSHYSGNTKNERLATEPVLKLWLRFENASAEQTVTPIDTTLMFFRRVLDDRIASYNVIFRAEDQKQRQGQFYYPFDRMAEDSEWRIVGQHTNESLKPGESFETFVPSEEGIEGFTGELIWRVHFRKGYGPKTGNGVTTLIDIRFNSEDITPEAA